MLRAPMVLAMGVPLAVAATHSRLNYDTRKLELRVQVDERLADKLAGEIAVFKAERAYLARPERIEPAARALGLEPAKGQQYVRLDTVAPAAEPGLTASKAPDAQRISALTTDR